jgi:hypothetical protein
MIYEDIMQVVLLKPASEGATNLRIVSGYASPAMLEMHLRCLKQAKLSVGIHLTIGMSKGALDAQDRRGYQDVVAADWGGSRVLGVRIINKGCQVHSKVYVWDGPEGYHKAFAGSANYSVSAMVEEKTMEVCAEVDWLEADQYVRECEGNARSVVNSSGDRKKWREQEMALSDAMPEESTILWDQSVDIPLLVRRAGRLEVPAKSGVNWGQREGREPNQAYLSLSAKSQDFFPAPPARFMLYTRRHGGFVAVRAQAEGKALQSSTNNSTLGVILRNAMGVELGAFVKTDDVIRAGLQSIRCYKMVSGDYFLDL